MKPTAHAIAIPPTRAEAWLLAGITLLALVASFFIATDRLTWFLEVVWAMVGLALITWRWSRFPLTRLLCWLLLLHALVLIHGGAHTYALTPGGFWLQDLLGTERNPWDRLGHLMQGFVPAILARELLLRLTPLRRGGWLVYLVLAALYESWSLPLTVILIVPMCLLSAMGGIWLVNFFHGMSFMIWPPTYPPSFLDNNIFTQIGLVVLMGLACKNAILIVEFARDLEEQGHGIVESAIEACRLRLRPILMTSLAFILGVSPLVFSSGAGAGARHSVGTGVMGGMLAATFLAIFFVPLFYKLITDWTVKEPRSGDEIRAEADHARAVALAREMPQPGHNVLPPEQR